jgi:hypothetical protein
MPPANIIDLQNRYTCSVQAFIPNIKIKISIRNSRKLVIARVDLFENSQKSSLSTLSSVKKGKQFDPDFVDYLHPKITP